MYRDPLIQKVIDMLEVNGPTTLVGHYVNGDVLKPDQSMLPLVYVTKDTVSIGTATNMEDEHQHKMVATLIMDMQQGLEGAYDVVAGMPELMEAVEARDPSTLQLKTDTLMYQLRKSQQLADKLWIAPRDSLDVNYGLGVSRRGPNIFSIEATIKFTVVQHLPRPGL